MKWTKTGCIYQPPGNEPWRISHAQVPTVDRLSEHVLRIYFGTRDIQNRTVTTFIDVEADEPHKIIYEHDRPVLGLGETGCFDDSGAMPTWIENRDGLRYLYYIGWNTGITVPYRNALGLAVSEKNSQRFTRAFFGPVVDRSREEPQFVGAACTLFDEGKWHLYYQHTVCWENAEDHVEPVYHIKYAQSGDGISWERHGLVCVDFKSPEEGGITRPCVLRDQNLYRMWYCYRNRLGFRTDKSRSYRIGYAESHDRVNWTRLDESVGIDVSNEGWDSEMIAYPCVYRHNGRLHMIYNGNGFGRSGFGHAVLTDD